MSSSSIHADPPPAIVTEPTGINYVTGSALGKGGFAICHKAERYNGNKATGQILALKIVKTRMEPAKLAQKFVTELQIHSKLSHANIVTFYRAFSFEASTYVVLELCPNGSLADLLKRRKYLTLPEIRRLIIQVCGAVKYLHHRHIVHRDLKTGNLFLDQNMNVKVGDFGLAALIVTEKEMEVKRRTTMCGTPNYLAPEILEKGKGHDEKVDLWAIGIISYTLAVGKAPFHASTKEEIYKKLKSGTYTWPELSATTNQSSDLRDLVSSLLVPEEQRPLPDKIVSHSFFRISFVPSAIPTSAREKAPSWPEVNVPSADVIRRGFSDAWFNLCKASGVGEYKEGECFPLNGGRKLRSIVYDMAKEAQAGRQPTMPIPKDVVYLSTVNDWDHINEERTAPAEGAKNTVSSRGLKEISHNEVATTRQRVIDREAAAADADRMPPPRAPSRLNRAGTVRKAARTISEEGAKSNEGLKITSDSSSGPSATLRLAKTRPTPAIGSTGISATTALKELNISSTSTYQTAQSQQMQDQEPAKTQSTATTKRSADASLARRPRGGRTMRERPVSPVEVPVTSKSNIAKTMRERPISMTDAPKSSTAIDEPKPASPFKYRRKAPVTDVIEILSDPEQEVKEEDELADALQALKLPPPPQMSKPLPVPHRRVASGIDPALPGTDPNTVLARLAIFRDNLATALSQSSTSIGLASAHKSGAPNAASELPFVSRWVDYSRKHGIGYVLSDGTVGVIINASPAKPGSASHPVTHVFARNGQRWLQKLGTRSREFHRVDHVPLDILEDRRAAGIQRKVYKGLGSVKEGPLLAEAERRRTLSVLWAKFGRYMCQALEGEEQQQQQSDPNAAAAPPSQTSSSSSSSSSSSGLEQNFVRFYQRIGNVGLWVFADGCVQVHFPDHTKIVLAADASAVSATVLSLEAAAHLARHGELLPAHVAGRQLLADGTGQLLREGGRVRQRVVRANQLAEKLEFVQEVVAQWVANGGLGRLDDDEEEGVGGNVGGIVWEGLAVRENAKKSDRVTVGRFGGDDVLAARRRVV